MPQSLSIDNFLDAHQEDERVNLCGKLAILRAILLAEAASHLRTDERGNVNFNGPENTWYTGVFQLLSEGIRLKDVERMLEGISFVIFNYDRAVEHYLHGAVMNYFRVDSAIATSVVRRAKFLHPYGRIAELPWQNPEGVRYGGAEDGVHYLKLARNIQTFTEQVADTQALAELKNAIQESSQLVFLGFAFHPQNMQLLMPSQSTDVTRVFATAYGFSKSDSDIVREEIRRSVVKDGGEYLIHLRSDLTCNQLFREYWRSLR
jgi:hypothetical protein